MYTHNYTWSTDTFRYDFEGHYEFDGIEPPNIGEREVLAQRMYDYIDEHFYEWSRDLLCEWRRYRDECLESSPNSFSYLGYVFTPYKKLEGIESAFDYISKNTAYAWLGDQLKPEWSYEDFYEASTDKECDVFACEGTLWIPASKYLFRWDGEKE